MGRKGIYMINIKLNIENLIAAKKLTEIAYNDLKNVKEFREAGSTGENFLTREVYESVMHGLSDLIEAARDAQVK